MAKKKTPSFWATVGVWSYLAGLAVALLVALLVAELEPWSLGTLVMLGLIVGLVNVSEKEAPTYLIAAIAFMFAADQLIGVFGELGSAFLQFQVLLKAVIVFTAPGALVVGFATLYKAAKDE